MAAGTARLLIAVQITIRNAAPMLGSMEGTRTRSSVRRRLAPQMRDCSSSEGSRLRSVAAMMRYAKVVPFTE